jgi:hypothetical protein
VVHVTMFILPTVLSIEYNVCPASLCHTLYRPHSATILSNFLEFSPSAPLNVYLSSTYSFLYFLPLVNERTVLSVLFVFLCIHLCFPQILSIFITIFVLPPPLTLLSVDSKLVCSGVDVVLEKKGTPMEQQRTNLRDTVVDFIRLFPH